MPQLSALLFLLAQAGGGGSGADGTFDPRERRVLETLAASLGLDADALEGGLREASEAALRKPLDAEEARRWFRELVHVALADTQLSRPERAFLARTSLRLGFPPGSARRELAAARLELWREARALRP